MGKILIIRDVDFSSVAVDTVTPLDETDITSFFGTFAKGVLVADSLNNNYGKTFYNPNSSSMTHSNFVDIQGYTTLRVNMAQYESSLNASGGLCFYSAQSDSSVVGSYLYNAAAETSMAEHTITIPAGAKYVRLTIIAAEQSDFYAYVS